jgi:uncharacterized protein
MPASRIPTAPPALPDDVIDPTIDCRNCEALCCRLTVVLLPGDEAVPEQFTTVDAHGLHVMAQGEDGWCAALDLNTMRCSIYEQRPGICRKFAMGSAFCRAERDEWRGLEAAMEASARAIPFELR